MDPDLPTLPRLTPVANTCLMTAVKDEGPDLLEWVAWHRLVGFDHILVWSNDCSDGSDLLLDRLEAIGWVRHFRHSPPEGVSAQDNVSRLAFDAPERAAADWVMWLDADEFLVIHPGEGHLADLIARLDRAWGVAVNWRVFGSMGIIKTDPSRLVTETFHRAAPLDDTFSRPVKTLYRNGPDIASLGIHRPIWAKGSDPRVLTSSGKPLNHRFLFQPKKNGRARDMVARGRQSWALAQINHYAIKALDRLALKRARGNGLEPGATADRFGMDYLDWFDRNEEEDRTIQRDLPALRSLIATALAEPGVAAAFRATVQAQADRLARVSGWIDLLLAQRAAAAQKVAV